MSQTILYRENFGLLATSPEGPLLADSGLPVGSAYDPKRTHLRTVQTYQAVRRACVSSQASADLSRHTRPNAPQGMPGAILVALR